MKTKLVYASVVLALSSNGFVTHAGSIIWTNIAGGNWSVAANWSPNQTPSPADTAVITNAGNYAVMLDVSPTLAGMALGTTSDDTTQTFLINGQTFTLNGKVTVNSNGQFNLNNGTLAGTNEFAGRLNWSGGSIGNGSSLTVATNGLLVIAGGGDQLFLGGVLTNAGTMQLVSGTLEIQGACYGGTGELINLPGALVDIQSDMLIDNFAGCSGVAFVNAGTVQKSGGTGTTTLRIPFNNSGTLDVQSGTVSINSGGKSSGQFETESGTTLNFGSYEADNGTVFTGAGTNLLGGGTFTTSGSVLFANTTLTGATLNSLLGTITGVLNMTGGTLSGQCTLVGTLNWYGGSINNGATLTVATNGLLMMAGGGNQMFVGGALTNAGTVRLVSGNLEIQGACYGGIGELINLPGALVDIQADVSINNFGGCTGAVFANAGTVRKSGGMGTTTLSIPFNNSGALDVQSGTVNINSGGSSSGQFLTAGGATLNFANSYEVGNGTVFEGAGTNLLSGGTFTTSGGVVFSNTTLTGATLTGVIAGVLNMTGGALIGTNTLVGTLNWYGGGFNGGTSLTVATNGLFAVMGNDLTLGGALTNAGTVQLMSSGLQFAGTCVGGTGELINLPGALVDIQDDYSMGNIGGCSSAVFVNAGTVRKSGGIGPTTLRIPFYNTGTLDVQSGTVSLNDGGVLGGNFQAATNAVIAFAGGRFAVNGPANLQGPGSIIFTGGSVSVTPFPTLIALKNGNSSVQIDLTTQAGMLSWLVDGTNQLNQKWFWLAEGTGGPQISFDELGILFGVSLSSSNATWSYLTQGTVVTLEFTLNGGSTGSLTSEISESVSVNNTTANPMALHLFAYSDFDMAGVPEGDTMSFPAINQVVQQGKGMMVTETVQSPAPSEWESSWYSITLDDLDGGSTVTLSDSMIPPDPGDQTFALQWDDATLGPGQTFTVNLTDSIRPISTIPINIALSIVLTQGNALISWPTAGIASFQLQTTSILEPWANWTAVTNLPSVIGSQYQVKVPRAAGSQFYRLENLTP